MAEKVSFAELIVRNVKVINSSRGFSWYKEQNFAKWYDKTLTDSHFDGFEERSDFLGEFFQKMLDQGYDFVIVSAAGNNSNGLPTKFDASYSFWLNGISGAKYPDVYNRIIVVGAVDQNLNIASYSDGGNRVDIYAPGGGLDKGVYSTLPNSKYGSKCGVDIMSGTSMAAPHVAGVAAMVWSANNSLTGAEVKEAITRRSNSHYSTAIVNKSLDELRMNELLPFQAGIDAGADAVMMGHLTLPQIPFMNAETRTEAGTADRNSDSKCSRKDNRYKERAAKRRPIHIPFQCR